MQRLMFTMKKDLEKQVENEEKTNKLQLKNEDLK